MCKQLKPAACLKGNPELDFLSSAGYVMALLLLWELCPGGLVLLEPVCSSHLLRGAYFIFRFCLTDSMVLS